MQKHQPPMTKATQENTSGLLGYLFFLTGIFVFLEISFFLQNSGFYLGDFKVAADHLKIPLAVIPGIAFFIFAQCFVHVGFTVLVWLVARLAGFALHLSWPKTQTLGFIFWALGLVTVLLANQYYFPNSKFAELTRLVVVNKIVGYLLLVFSILCFSALLVAFFGLVRAASCYWRTSLALLFTTAIGSYSLFQAPLVVADASSVEKPNIIIIGVDGVRPDYLSYFGGSETPHFDAFLNQSIVFAEALTPIARTFPAWMNILTGQYPKHSHARFDLADPAQLDLTQTLPAILQKQGYETVYATDETRFSNIDESFGFHHIVTPPIGFNDFLLGTFNDFPISNLVVNTALGKWLFPHSYGNRPAIATYDPNSFLFLLKPVIVTARQKPLFLAVHFCLPHYPYFWAQGSYLETTKAIAHYNAAVMRADQQVGEFLAMLEKSGVLKHSIVVLLSDHGEALELHGDRITDRALFIAGANNKQNKLPQFYPKSFTQEKVNQSAGHGTDVLGFTQYHPLLAFRLYGIKNSAPRLVPGVVSLMDIKPTILNLLNLPIKNVDGTSLRAVIEGKALTVAAKDFFTESDFSPQAVRTIHPQTRKVLFEGIDFFQINPVTLRITVKKSMAEMILTSKQFADIYGDWVLAVYPQRKGIMMPILVNLKTGEWTNDLRTSFALNSPAQRMLQALRNFYKEEILAVEGA